MIKDFKEIKSSEELEEYMRTDEVKEAVQADPNVLLKYLERAAELFNEGHPDMQIEVGGEIVKVPKNKTNDKQKGDL